MWHIYVCVWSHTCTCDPIFVCVVPHLYVWSRICMCGPTVVCVVPHLYMWHHTYKCDPKLLMLSNICKCDSTVHWENFTVKTISWLRPNAKIWKNVYRSNEPQKFINMQIFLCENFPIYSSYMYNCDSTFTYVCGNTFLVWSHIYVCGMTHDFPKMWPVCAVFPAES